MTESRTKTGVLGISPGLLMRSIRAWLTEYNVFSAMQQCGRVEECMQQDEYPQISRGPDRQVASLRLHMPKLTASVYRAARYGDNLLSVHRSLFAVQDEAIKTAGLPDICFQITTQHHHSPQTASLPSGTLLQVAFTDLIIMQYPSQRAVSLLD